MDYLQVGSKRTQKLSTNQGSDSDNFDEMDDNEDFF